MPKKPSTPKLHGVESWPASTVEMRRLDKIKPYPNNPRTHPPAQIDMLAGMMKRHGVDQPIVVDDDGVILKGHGRRLAALAAGFERFPVVVHKGLSDDEKRAMRIADNQAALLAGWDAELMRMEVGELKLDGYDLALLGFGEAQLVTFTTTPGPPGEFPAFGDDIETKYCCPSCGYRWSGDPLAGANKAPPPKEKNGKAKRKAA